MAEFKYPAIHGFPPLYTKQVNAQTWEAQVASWKQLILEYCAHHRMWILGTEHVTLGLFNNTHINRQLKPDTLRLILAELVKCGAADWCDEADSHTVVLASWPPARTRESVLVYFKKPAEWAKQISQWVDRTGQNGAVLTCYEIAHGDMSQGQEFARIHSAMLARALLCLAEQQRATLIKQGARISGVKFV